MRNRVREYYQNNREILIEKARNRYRQLLEPDKAIKRQYGRNRYQNMSEEDKLRLKEYQKNFREAKKSTQFFFYLNFFLHCIKWDKKS